MRTYTVKDLKQYYNDGHEVTFDIVAHSQIPSTVFLNGKMIGKVRLNTTTAFNKFVQIEERKNSKNQ